MTDPISDMLIRIKNAQAVEKETVSFGYSKIRFDIAAILERQGYLGEVQKKGKKNGKIIEVGLLYENDRSPKISGARRISKPSRRIYKGYSKIFPIKKGMGLALYSTTKGLLTDSEARKSKVGGELLLEVW